MKVKTNKARSVTYSPSLFECIDRPTIAKINSDAYPDTDTKGKFENVNNLYVMLNTWFNMCTDLGVDYKHFSNAIMLYGLKAVLKDIDEYRLAVLTGHNAIKLDWMYFLESLPTDVVTRICGFPKRTLLNTGHIDDNWIDFCRNNIGMDERTYSPYLAEKLRTIIERLVRGYKRDVGKFILPPGATAEGCHTYFEKWGIVNRQLRWLVEHDVRLPLRNIYCPTVNPDNTSRYQTVPKNAFKRRGIAMEPVVKQVYGYQIDASLRSLLLRDGIDLSNQERNQFAAFIGSLPANVDNAIIDAHPYANVYPDMAALGKDGRRVATIDLSAASDSIRAILVSDMIPSRLYEDLFVCRSPYVKYKWAAIRSYRWATMGSAITFSLESLIFRAIQHLAYDLYNTFTKSRLKLSALDLVYGDDITVDVRVAPIMVDLLKCFGFDVNPDKTYLEGPYRESCGVEYLNGEDVTINFFPRGTSRYELPELVALQHKLHAYTRANGFLVSCIRELAPRITDSRVGSSHDDIWTNRYVREPHAGSWYRQPTAEYYTIKYGFAEAYQPTKLRLKEQGNVATSDNTDCISSSLSSSIDLEGKPIVMHRIKCKYATKQNALDAIKKLSEMWFRYKEDQCKTDALYERMHLVTVLDTWEDTVDVRFNQPVDLTYHTTFSVNLRPVPKRYRDECELLMYYLTIGGGIEHVNNSPFTDPRDYIHDRRSLVQRGNFQITTAISFD